MELEHWMTEGLRGATGTFQRAAREYAEEYAAMAVAAERERCAKLCEQYADDADAWRPRDDTRGAAVREIARRIRGPNV